MWANKITDALKCKIQVLEDVVGNPGQSQIVERAERRPRS